MKLIIQLSQNKIIWYNLIYLKRFFYEINNTTLSRVAGAGGILLDPEVKIEQTYAWGIGCRTNNEVEWIALL